MTYSHVSFCIWLIQLDWWNERPSSEVFPSEGFLLFLLKPVLPVVRHAIGSVPLSVATFQCGRVLVGSQVKGEGSSHKHWSCGSVASCPGLSLSIQNKEENCSRISVWMLYFRKLQLENTITEEVFNQPGSIGGAWPCLTHFALFSCHGPLPMHFGSLLDILQLLLFSNYLNLSFQLLKHMSNSNENGY